MFCGVYYKEKKETIETRPHIYHDESCLQTNNIQYLAWIHYFFFISALLCVLTLIFSVVLTLKLYHRFCTSRSKPSTDSSVLYEHLITLLSNLSMRSTTSVLSSSSSSHALPRTLLPIVHSTPIYHHYHLLHLDHFH